jgi:hypothetical protein
MNIAGTVNCEHCKIERESHREHCATFGCPNNPDKFCKSIKDIERVNAFFTKHSKSYRRRQIMGKVGFFRVLGMVGMLAEELSKAAEDGKLTADELLTIGAKIAQSLNIELIDFNGVE